MQKQFTLHKKLAMILSLAKERSWTFYFKCRFHHIMLSDIKQRNAQFEMWWKWPGKIKWFRRKYFLWKQEGKKCPWLKKHPQISSTQPIVCAKETRMISSFFSFQVTLGKVLKAIVVMRSLFIDRTIVRGFHENIYSEDGKVKHFISFHV